MLDDESWELHEWEDVALVWNNIEFDNIEKIRPSVYNFLWNFKDEEISLPIQINKN